MYHSPPAKAHQESASYSQRSDGDVDLTRLSSIESLLTPSTHTGLRARGTSLDAVVTPASKTRRNPASTLGSDSSVQPDSPRRLRVSEPTISPKVEADAKADDSLQ